MNLERNEEWNNFMSRAGEVCGLVHELASGDAARARRASALAERYLAERPEGSGASAALQDGLRLRSDRTIISRARPAPQAGQAEREAWMAEVSADAERRHAERAVRREQADTLRRRATAQFRRGEYARALACYERACSLVRDSPSLWTERALCALHVREHAGALDACKRALDLHAGSFKARLYRCKALQETGAPDLHEHLQELRDSFPQHEDLVTYFLDKQLEGDKADGEHDDGSGEEEGQEGEQTE